MFKTLAMLKTIIFELVAGQFKFRLILFKVYEERGLSYNNSSIIRGLWEQGSGRDTPEGLM